MGLPTLPVEPNGASKWVKLVTQLGIPTVLAGILLWFIMTRLIGALDHMTAEMDKQSDLIQKFEATCMKPH